MPPPPPPPLALEFYLGVRNAWVPTGNTMTDHTVFDVSSPAAEDEWRNISLPMPPGTAWASSIALNVTNRTNSPLGPRTVLVQSSSTVPNSPPLTLPAQDYDAAPNLACYFSQTVTFRPNPDQFGSTASISPPVFMHNQPMAHKVAQLADNITIQDDIPVLIHAAADAMQTVPSPSCIVGSATTVATAKVANTAMKGLIKMLTSQPTASTQPKPAVLVSDSASTAPFAPSALVQGTADMYIDQAKLSDEEMLKSVDHTAQTARCTTDPGWAAPFIVYPDNQFGPQRGVIKSALFDTTAGQCETTFRSARYNQHDMNEQCQADPACTGFYQPHPLHKTAAAPLTGFAAINTPNSIPNAVMVQPWPRYAADIIIPPSGENYDVEPAQHSITERNLNWAQQFTDLQIADATTTEPPQAIQLVQLNYETRRKPSKADRRKTAVSVAMSSVALGSVLTVVAVGIMLWILRRKEKENDQQRPQARMKSYLKPSWKDWIV